MRTLCQARQRLSGFLLRHGRHYHRPAWTQLYRCWLAGLKFDQPVHHIVLKDCIAAVEAAMARRDRLEVHIEAVLPERSLAPVSETLQALRSVRVVAAATLVAELSATSRASPINAGSWRISAWCRPSIPATARDARAALPEGARSQPVRRIDD